MSEPPIYETDAEALAVYVGDTKESSSAYVEQCAAEARRMVEDHTGTAEVPPEILNRAVLEVGAELYHRKTAPSGMKQFATEFGGSPVRIARDPMVAARPLLAPYVPAGIG